MEKRFIEEGDLLEDSYRLAVQIYKSGYRPDFIVGVWRGGSTVGIYVQECLQYLGVETDHIAIRTSYRGMHDYLQKLEEGGEILVHGLKYLLDEMNAGDNLLIVDDVYGTGRSVAAVIDRLQAMTRLNMSKDLRIAAPYYRSQFNTQNREPDYYLHEYQEWLVLPYELTGLSASEIQQHKPWVKPLLDELTCLTK
ncbi:MAG: phosphoribosyltransferase [Gammaproteobacteria bacterium]|nr:phosphoribosyltransferase [Gammaproteobacteria bacterium]